MARTSLFSEKCANQSHKGKTGPPSVSQLHPFAALLHLFRWWQTSQYPLVSKKATETHRQSWLNHWTLWCCPSDTAVPWCWGLATGFGTVCETWHDPLKRLQMHPMNLRLPGRLLARWYCTYLYCALEIRFWLIVGWKRCQQQEAKFGTVWLQTRRS